MPDSANHFFVFLLSPLNPTVGYSNRHDQPMAPGQGSPICQRVVGEYPLSVYDPAGSLNFLVRTCILGGSWGDPALTP